MYGYGVLERFRARSMGFWAEVGRASVYQALRRMESDGLIAGRAQEGTEGPDRRVFRITRAGRDRLRAGLVERAAELAPYETGAGLSLGFAHLLSAAEVAADAGRPRARRPRSAGRHPDGARADLGAIGARDAWSRTRCWTDRRPSPGPSSHGSARFRTESRSRRAG